MAVVRSGLYKLGARYYDPSTGRFTQFDPSGQEANPYLYGAANPINASDPTGLSVVGALAEGAVNIIGGALVAGICINSGGLLCAAASIGLGALFGGIGGIAKEAIDGGKKKNWSGAFGDGAVTGAFVGSAFGLIGRYAKFVEALKAKGRN